MSNLYATQLLLKGGIVVIETDTGAAQRLIALQYNPETLSRTFQVQGAGGEQGDRSEALRLKGPPVETFRLEAEIDATDQLEFPDQNASAVRLGIHPQLAALETLVYPFSGDLWRNNQLASRGSLEIVPMEGPLTVFVWSRHRVMPVRITELSVTEEAFDAALNPIRAKVSLGMRVLSVNDVGFLSRAGNLFMGYQMQKEQLARMAPPGDGSAIGLSPTSL